MIARRTHLSVKDGIYQPSSAVYIDHPPDPANKYLMHSSVQSSDMKDIYDGVATLDAGGEAVITMPGWFGSLNRDFRYQLTCIGGFAPVYIATELANNQFKIGGGREGMKVSWQVTGIRQDAWPTLTDPPWNWKSPIGKKAFTCIPNSTERHRSKESNGREILK
ncbi:MAG: hypothetical protein WAL56_13475 [Candidatus Sulfotelmatobacter sp.]